jgi:carbonic anhydrase
VRSIYAVLALSLTAMPLLAEADTQHPAQPTPAAALELLIKGNRRYVADKPLHPHQNRRLRHDLVVKGQHPFATVLSCSDSRVPPELIFDEGLGDLFVIRVAGNVVDDAITGSIEYAAEHLHVPLVVVLGHSNCGAVDATIHGGEPNTHIDALVKAIKPAVDQARTEPGPLLVNAVRDNVKLVVQQLRDSQPILGRLHATGKIKIIGAVYDLDKGTVEYLK